MLHNPFDLGFAAFARGVARNTCPLDELDGVYWRVGWDYASGGRRTPGRRVPFRPGRTERKPKALGRERR